jgi:hypothetical protein
LAQESKKPSPLVGGTGLVVGVHCPSNEEWIEMKEKWMKE